MSDIYPPESKREKRTVPSPQPPVSQPSNKPRSPSDGRLSRNRPKGK